jgi:hypothetical protein
MIHQQWFAWYPVRDYVTRRWFFWDTIWCYKWNKYRPWRYEEFEEYWK